MIDVLPAPRKPVKTVTGMGVGGVSDGISARCGQACAIRS